jgi:hypothetical protein
MIGRRYTNPDTIVGSVDQTPITLLGLRACVAAAAPTGRNGSRGLPNATDDTLTATGFSAPSPPVTGPSFGALTNP